MTTDNIAKYLELKKQAAAIESQIEELKPVVLEDVRKSKSRVQHEGYDFLISHITTWTFSPAIGQIQTALTEAKRAEKRNGLATVKGQRDVLIVREHRDRPAPNVSDERIKQVREARPRAYEKWTTEEEDVLRNEFLQGQSIEEIAEHLQRQIGGIRSRLVKQGLIEK